MLLPFPTFYMSIQGNLKASKGKNGGFPGGSDSKEPTCNAGDLGLIPGLGRSMEKGHYPLHSWASRIPWTEEPSRLQSMGSQRTGHI